MDQKVTGHLAGISSETGVALILQAPAASQLPHSTPAPAWSFQINGFDVTRAARRPIYAATSPSSVRNPLRMLCPGISRRIEVYAA
jgi:hypothetical protein